MSEAILAPSFEPTGKPYLEQRIFGWSPAGTLPTAAILFGALYGLYLLAGLAEGVSTLEWTGHSVTFNSGAWSALVLSLLIAAALGMQRYTRLKDASDQLPFAAIFSGGAETAARLAGYAPDDAKLGRATLVGVALGLIGSFLILQGQSDARAHAPAVLVWFVIAITLSAVLFARGAELTRKSSAAFEVTLRDELKIDLLRVDRLAVIGRSAARASLVWFVVSAVVCLFFVEDSIDLPSIAIMLICAAMGLAIFLRVILRVHHKIVEAKAVELEHLRCEIEQARQNLREDPLAATRAQGLLAYEARIAAAPEWPFDQTTLVRVGASTLIVTVPWFGQALASYMVDHFSSVVH
jgi:hypothetical protein